MGVSVAPLIRAPSQLARDLGLIYDIFYMEDFKFKIFQNLSVPHLVGVCFY